MEEINTPAPKVAVVVFLKRNIKKNKGKINLKRGFHENGVDITDKLIIPNRRENSSLDRVNNIALL